MTAHTASSPRPLSDTARSWLCQINAALWTGLLLAVADYGLAILGCLAAIHGVPGFDGIFGPDSLEPGRVTVRFFAIASYGIISTLFWRRR